MNVAECVNRFQLKRDPDLPERCLRIGILNQILHGTIYDNLPPFWMEYTGETSGAYVPLLRRKPSVIYLLPKIVVDESVSMLFSEWHTPIARCDENDSATQFIQYITRQCNLMNVMLDAARKGSVGSACIMIRVLNGKFHLEAMGTQYLTPIFYREEPTKLIGLIEMKKVLGKSLQEVGYAIEKPNSHYWFRREWTENEEIYYFPYLVTDAMDEKFIPTRNEDLTIQHGLGFLPAVWIKNLPGGDGIDGLCTFGASIDIMHEINYQLSQQGRLLRYNSDPTLVVKNSSALEGQELMKGLGAIMLDEGGDAKFLQLSDGATKSVMEYTKVLREYALEVIRGNRSNPDKISAAQSGKALQMLNSPLISLADELRMTYGEFGLVTIYKMLLKIASSGIYDIRYPIPYDFGDTENCDILLNWPDWYPKTPQDNLQTAQTLKTLREANLISVSTGIKTLADDYNITNVEEEEKNIEYSCEMLDNVENSSEDETKQRLKND